MKVQSRLGVTIPNSCSCNCWGSIRQETPGDSVQLFHEGCDGYTWIWCSLNNLGERVIKVDTQGDLTYTPTIPDELVFVVLEKSGCCQIFTETKWVSL